MSLWDAILKRGTLDDFWCHDGYCEPDCQCRHGLGTCPALVIHKEYLALRAVVEAMLGELTPAEHVTNMRRFVDRCGPKDSDMRDRVSNQAATWEGIA